jgi:hypothetical protein
LDISKDLEERDQNYPFYHNKLGSIVVCKIIKMRIRQGLVINSICVEFKNGARFTIIKADDKRKFFDLNKEMLDPGTIGKKYLGFEVNIED